MDAIAILDFGSQYTQLIARRVREARVYCELFPFNETPDRVLSLKPKGFILSGGPSSVYEPDAPKIPTYVLESGLPILGICYGMQALTHALGGKVAPSSSREYGFAEIEVRAESDLLHSGIHTVWMSHGDRIEATPPDFEVLASSKNSPVAAMGDHRHKRYGLQFHPEVHHTPGGFEILRAFVIGACGARADWTSTSIIDTCIDRIRAQVGDQPVLAATSGGVDSSVATALAHQAVGENLTAIFVNTGMLRSGEPEAVVEALNGALSINLIAVDATESFLSTLEGVIDPEDKRRLIGETFIRTFEEQAQNIGEVTFLVQGTIYPDVVESSGPERRLAARIKTHHNVGGLPDEMDLELVEPLRDLFKDEVREIGKELGLPSALLMRQPFPGPGLAVRCLGEVNSERLARLRAADRIVLEELQTANLLDGFTSQAFAVLLPVRSVGVMGDQRTYGETIAVRAVTTEDYMTADWSPIPHEILSRISNRIVNEVEGVNRVVYDITSKPPATIEWE